MAPQTVFAIANNGILVFWVLLAVAPGWKGTHVLVHSIVIPVIIGLTYAWLMGSVLLSGALPESANFSSLAGVMAFFTSPAAATAGWIHYLVFDLFIGAWQARDATRRGVPYPALLPCLILTLLAGPIGLLLYIVLRAALGKGGFFLNEAPAAAS